MLWLSIVFIDPPEAMGPYGSATMTKMVVGAPGEDHTSNGFKRESASIESSGHTGVGTDNALRSFGSPRRHRGSMSARTASLFACGPTSNSRSLQIRL